MRTKVLLTLAVVGMLFLSFTAMTSNMGFKINIPLEGGALQNWVSLPYYNSYTSVSLIFNELSPNVVEISHWLPASYGAETYTSDMDPDFGIVAGEAISVKLSSAQNWVVVGSHNPTATIAIAGGAVQNWVAVPYHTMSTMASTLINEIPNCVEIAHWLPASYGAETYTSDMDPDFAITAGQGYGIKCGGADQNWTPSHY